MDTEEPWPVRERETEYDTGWYQGGYDLVEQPDGSTKRYFWASLPPAVVVVARRDDELVFVEQYRPTIRQHHVELPAGIVESAEDYVEAAQRELKEETGYEANELSLMQEVQVATGVLDHRRGYVWADDLEDGEPALEGNEFLRTRHVPIESALEVTRERPANDASVMGLLLADLEGHLELERSG